jgi:hypothetical protein
VGGLFWLWIQELSWLKWLQELFWGWVRWSQENFWWLMVAELFAGNVVWLVTALKLARGRVETAKALSDEQLDAADLTESGPKE